MTQSTEHRRRLSGRLAVLALALVMALGSGCLGVDAFQPSPDTTIAADTSPVDTGVAEELPCIPQCTQRECGTDGCGGSCGLCNAHDTCTADGQCLVPVGDRCAAPFVVDAATLPYRYSGSTATGDAHADFGTALLSCDAAEAPAGLGSRDQVFSFAPTVTAVYELRLEAAFDGILSVRAACDEASAACIAADSRPELDDVVTVALDVGRTYTIVVDGYGDDVENAGAYTLTVGAPCVPDCDGAACGDDGCGGSCGTCETTLGCRPDRQCVARYEIAGNTCAAPYPISSLPFTATGDTRYATDDGAAEGATCDIATSQLGAGAPDHIYQLVAPGAGIYRVEVQADFVAAVYRRDECDATSACSAVVADFGDLSLDLSLEPGEIAWLVIDGAADGEAGRYTLNVSAPCLPACDQRTCGDDGCGGVCGRCGSGLACDDNGACVSSGDVAGNVCQNPLEIGELPAQVAGDTDVNTNNYLFPAGACPGLEGGPWGGDSPDAVYHLVASGNTSYQINLYADFDSLLTVFTVCGDAAGSCLAGDDHLGMGTETVTVDVPSGTDLFVVVDGFSSHGPVSGRYTLAIEAGPLQP